jgi:uncharacterized protein YceH (UPF0502 family)
MEKARTVPDSYPLSLNALLLGCNQKTSRDPVMDISEDQAQLALAGLKALSLVFDASASRVPRYEHNLQRGLRLTEAQAVLMGLLMLKGPQTPGELRIGSERWYRFADIATLEDTLAELKERGDEGGAALVQQLPRSPGMREQRWVHLLCGDVATELSAQATGIADAGGEPVSLGQAERLLQRMDQLELKVQALETQLAFVQKELGLSQA